MDSLVSSNSSPAASPQDAAGVCPPPVIRGANRHESFASLESTVCIDWMRFVIPEATRSRVESEFYDRFGPAASRKGRFFMRESLRWADGVSIHFGGDIYDVRHAVVEVPGAALARLGSGDSLGLLKLIQELGGRCTRLDVARDFTGDPVSGLVDRVLDACKAGELCGARVWRPHHEYSGESLVSASVLIGRRGSNGSGRYVRVYDKGAEQGSGLGHWVRWEAEFSDECAADAAIEIATASDAEAAMASLVRGAVEFRSAGDRKSRRVVCEWFDELHGVVASSVRRAVRSSTLESFGRWFQSSVAPQLVAFAEMADMTIRDALGFVVGDLSQYDGQPVSDRVIDLVRHRAAGSLCVVGSPPQEYVNPWSKTYAH